MNIKILVADTSSKVRENFTRSLKEIGVQSVREAGDANTAINLLWEEQFNAVLTDGELEIESGQSLVEEIRYVSNVPIIVTIDQAELSPIFEMTLPSASVYLTKPFTTQSLREKLQQLVPALVPAIAG